MPCNTLDALLAEARVAAEADACRDAWWETELAIGLALEGDPDAERIAEALERLADAERRARIEIRAALEQVERD